MSRPAALRGCPCTLCLPQGCGPGMPGPYVLRGGAIYPSPGCFPVPPAGTERSRPLPTNHPLSLHRGGGMTDCRKRCAHPLAPSARGLRPQAVGERTVRLSEIFRAMARFSPSAPSGHLPRRGRFFDTLKPPFDKGGFFLLAHFFIFFSLLEYFSIVLHKLVAFTVPIIL